MSGASRCNEPTRDRGGNVLPTTRQGYQRSPAWPPGGDDEDCGAHSAEFKANVVLAREVLETGEGAAQPHDHAPQPTALRRRMGHGLRWCY